MQSGTVRGNPAWQNWRKRPICPRVINSLETDVEEETKVWWTLTK